MSNHNFTNHLKCVKDLARELAQSYTIGCLGSEFLIAGMLSVTDCMAAKLLNEMGITLKAYREKLRLFAKNCWHSDVYTGDSPRTKRIFEKAQEYANRSDGFYVGTEHVLRAILDESESYAVLLLQELSVDVGYLTKLCDEFIKGPMRENDVESEERGKPFVRRENVLGDNVSKYGTDLTQRAAEGKLDPVVGRRKEIEKVVQILSRRTKNNPVLIGEPGVGKTAVIEGLAQDIVSGNVPEMLRNKTVFSLNLSTLVAGTRYRGDFEERLSELIRTIKDNSNVILFIDEIHLLVGAGGSKDNDMDAANILKPMLARGELQTVGATTLEEYRKYIEKDPALERRFTPVIVDEPTEEDAITILRGVKDKYEAHHNVAISDEAIRAAVRLSDRYITDRFLPDKAIDVIDEAASRARIHAYNGSAELREGRDRFNRLLTDHTNALKWKDEQKAQEIQTELDELGSRLDELEEQFRRERSVAHLSIGAEDVAEIVSSWTGVPVSKLTEKESNRLIHLEEELHRRIVGQDEAVTAVSKAIRRARAGLQDPNRPIGSFIFVGPTGVGKTDLAKALAESMFGDENLMVRLDMSEYMEKSSVSKLIGAPPGYVGYDENGSSQLTEKIRRKPYSVVLFDEIEKAHPDVFNLLLQILDDGRLTDSRGRVVSFKNTVLIMTSNVGAHEVQTMGSLGFRSEDAETAYGDMKAQIENALKARFKPEFLNRLDDIIIFHKLTREEAAKICDKILEGLAKRVAAKGVVLKVSRRAKSFLLDEGYNEDYGARPLKRAVQRFVENKLAEEILLGNIPEKGTVLVDELNGDITITAE